MKSILFTLLAATALTSASPIEAETLEKRAVTCLRVGATATATWKNAAGRTCRWTGTVGSNFGTNSVTGGEYVHLPLHINLKKANSLSYSCNGRCGAGCSGTAVGNAYTQDCFSHDVCSWFNNASGGARYVLKAYIEPACTDKIQVMRIVAQHTTLRSMTRFWVLQMGADRRTLATRLRDLRPVLLARKPDVFMRDY